MGYKSCLHELVENISIHRSSECLAIQKSIHRLNAIAETLFPQTSSFLQTRILPLRQYPYLRIKLRLSLPVSSQKIKLSLLYMLTSDTNFDLRKSFRCSAAKLNLCLVNPTFFRNRHSVDSDNCTPVVLKISEVIS